MAERGREEVAAQLDRRLAELYAIQELAYVLADSLELERIADQATACIQRFLDVGGVALVLAGESDPQLRIETATGSLAHLIDTPVPEDDRGLLLEAVGSERVQLALPDAPHPRPLFGERRFEGTMVAPMRAHGVTIGAIVAVEPRDGAFTTEDVRLLSAVATHTAVVLSNARFFELIRRGNRDWEAVFEALTAGLALVDARRRIRRGNRALADLAGRPIPALVGEDIAGVLGLPAGPLTQLIEGALRGTAPTPLTVQRDPGRRILRISAAPTGKERGAVVLIEDVTEQKALQTELIQSEKLAAVGHLVSGVAHELNNPLTSIAGLAELLLEQTDTPPRTRMHLEVVHEQAERAGRIVQNLLTFARKGPPQPKPLDLNVVARRTMQLMAREFETSGVELTPRLASGLPSVLADEHQLLQVTVNLLTNALQAVREVPKGEVRRVVVETAGSERVATLRVRDTGPGIPDPLADQIFTPFFTTKEPGRGTGLGLSISYRIVEAHNGSLTATREDGETVFTVVLPTLPQAVPGALVGGTAPPSAIRRVLIIDDDPAARRVARTFFAQDGHHVDALPAQEGLTAALASEFDAVVVDSRAASPAGESVLDVLLPNATLRGRLVVASDVPRSSDSGIPCIGKPFNLKELGTAVRRLWGGVGSASEPGDA